MLGTKKYLKVPKNIFLVSKIFLELEILCYF